ncbi:MAG: nucleotide exchange factor GrpE [Verrucomicrobia bacterium]|nr:MAG: nucleotide exchange factor GrpE [Verrucomicrobiota bacterium]
MSERTQPKVHKLPFFFADAVLLGVAWLIFSQSKTPMTAWQTFFCAASVALGATFGVMPFLLEYRAAMKLAEADRLTNAVLQIENLEIIGRQIANATAGWQTAQEHADKAVEAAREIADGITKEARAFSEFLQKANDTEKNHLRLEVDKLRRAENEWLQVLVRLLDHTYALYQAAVGSGQGNLVEQLGHFQNACRDIARRVGLVPFVATPGEPFDSKVHQLADANVVPAAEARVAETIATGYTFQGQVVRTALVTLQNGEAAGQPSPGEFATETQPPTAEVEPEFIVGPAAEIPQSPGEPAVSEQEWVQKEPPEEEQDEFRT